MKFLFIFLSLFVSTLLFSQAPEGINYQAVMRNSSGNLVTNSTVAIRVQIRQGSSTGTTVYQERHSIISSSQGLINMVIGAGMPQTIGTFNNINWAVGPFFVNLAVDFSNGANYQDFGTQQLMSVPYALYAKTSGAQLNQWRYGNTVPVNSLGVLGDFYLDVVTGNVYYKNSATTWVLTGNIKGPVGPSGAVGAQGPQGIQGATGAQGNQGNQGVAGTNGTNGTNGQNTLVKTTTESAGANCTTGGVKIEYGLDANSNGTLDISEINATLTKYVCNGAAGATGAQGIQGLTGAQGIQGIAGTAGNNGTNGTDGKNTLAKTTTEAAGANCTTGGVKIEYGLDANSNGTLDVSEINATFTKYVCNGAVGATGAQGIQGLTGAQGIQGVAGTNGAQGIQGVAGTNGTNGVDGQNTLAKTTTESAGANCTTGGVKIEYGLDANINGTLDVSEINATLTRYVCNGATGAQGIQGLTGAQGIQGVAGSTGAAGAAGKNTLVKTTTETAGANCTTGGVKIEYGLDANNNGTLDVSEINASLTKYVCNGAVGATGATGAQGVVGANGTNGTNGLNALIITTTEPAGANCTNGGTKIETGLDANANSVLDAGEVNASQTQYLCNGGGSINVSGSGQGFNSNHGLMNILSDTILVANQSKLVEVILRGGNGGSGGYSGSICPGGSGGWGGGSGGTGAGIRFLLNVATGDTLDIKKGIDGLNGCSTCIYTGVCNCCYAGQSGTAGTSSKISINSLTSSNFIFEAHGGGEGGAQWGSLADSGANGSLITGNQYNSVGAFILESNLNGQGAAVILRW